MSSIASTPDHNSARSRSRTTPRSGLSTGGSRSRRGKAEARSKFDAALGLPAVKEEEEEEDKGGGANEKPSAAAAAVAVAAAEPAPTARATAAPAPAKPTAAKATSSQSEGMFSLLKKGAMQFMSPAKEPETIDLMDASDDEVEVTKVVKPSAAAVKQEDDQGKPAETNDDDASMLTAKDVDDMSFHELRSECKIRNLGGNGKKGDLQEKLKAVIPASIGDTTVPPSPMSSIASTPDHNSARSRSRTTPRSGLSTGGSRSRRGKAEARSKFDAALGLPAVKEEEEEEGAATSVMATPAQRPGRRRKKADDDEDQSIADESASKPTPAKRQKRTKTAATPASARSAARSTRSTRSAAKSTRSGRHL